MKKLRYVGPGANWAQFGKLRPDQEIEVTFIEALELRDHPDFEVVSNRSRPHEVIELAGAPTYDLRKIRWDNPKLPGLLLATSLSTLLLLAQAASEIGCDIIVTDQEDRQSVANKLVELAHLNGWVTLGENARAALPVLAQPVLLGTASDDDDDDDEKTGDEGAPGDDENDGTGDEAHQAPGGATVVEATVPSTIAEEVKDDVPVPATPAKAAKAAKAAKGKRK